MRQLTRTLVGLSTAAALAAFTAPGAGAQAEAKKQAPPPAEKKQPPPPPEKKQAAPAHKMMNADDLNWGTAPAGLPAAAQAAVLQGDPGKAGLFTVRLKAPDGAQVMPHWHPADEQVTVITGTVMLGMGRKWDEASMQAVNTGGYVSLPRKQSHYVKMKGETIIQITAMGPFAITYVDPKDDPRKK